MTLSTLFTYAKCMTSHGITEFSNKIIGWKATCPKPPLHEGSWSLTNKQFNNSNVEIFINICIKPRKLNSQNELQSSTVHLWKSWNTANKGYIHCTCRINLQKSKYRFTLIKSLPNPDNSNSYWTLHRKHWSTVQISERLCNCTTSFFRKT